jgi:hypothetical protein
MGAFKPLPDQPEYGVDDDDVVHAWMDGATTAEFDEWLRTGVLPISVRVKWWWRRTRRILR